MTISKIYTLFRFPQLSFNVLLLSEDPIVCGLKNLGCGRKRRCFWEGWGAVDRISPAGPCGPQAGGRQAWEPPSHQPVTAGLGFDILLWAVPGNEENWINTGESLLLLIPSKFAVRAKV